MSEIEFNYVNEPQLEELLLKFLEANGNRFEGTSEQLKDALKVDSDPVRLRGRLIRRRRWLESEGYTYRSRRKTGYFVIEKVR
jgi:hypothetical protein